MIFVFMLCLGLLTQFVYFKYDFASCTVLLICWFFLILCSYSFYIGKVYVLSGEIALKNTHYYYSRSRKRFFVINITLLKVWYNNIKSVDYNTYLFSNVYLGVKNTLRASIL